MNTLKILSFMALISITSQAAERFGGIYFDSSIPANQVFSLKEDLTYLYQSDFENLDSDFSLFFELEEVNGPTLYNWIFNRVKYIVGQDYRIRGRNYVTKRGYEFPATPLPGSSSFQNTDAFGGVVVMSNIGAGLYLSGKKSKLLKGAKINRQKVFATSPRVGILQIGEGLFLNSILINDEINSEANKIKRLGTLFHEARHSDGNSEHVGFNHHTCPEGHTLYGFSACEMYGNGSYQLEAIATKNLLANCLTCSVEDKTKLEASIADGFDRVLTVSHRKSEEQLLHEMESYKKVIDFYIDFMVLSPSQNEFSQKELDRFTAMYEKAKSQLFELRNTPAPKMMDSTPEGDFSESSIEESNMLIEASVK
ncbi:hypothetical protein M902_0785 [Bacteriovorax sp. BAL6_X]|uniref:hypothetical protein n=1 Tax=Bacteriovorax sp. BAL6_X TaxID=1201290 RepID=UPI0003861D4B|nr:hypothetical protein [Bacteriovorax sp. BAL6_X]EPZ49822.1 hypothetical protein M902_0785 [Bacteriovorax sp. BAL6_X]